MDLNLPELAVSNRISITPNIQAGENRAVAWLEGPGCIQHIWVGISDPPKGNRDVIMRIFFDEKPIPNVEVPIGDFFGVMHNQNWYPINTRYISVQAKNTMNCYFPMPFSKSSRIEFECGSKDQGIFMQVDWHRYPDQELKEQRRFCSRWRREMPTQRYGEDFIILDADGPGQLVGFVYGVNLLDDVDRWSHGGADNIYIDGDGQYPSLIRGIGGEDTFGTGSGGVLHPPATHLYSEMPYYEHIDVGDARATHRIVGYRFFEHDTILFQKSLHMRFGTMRNDISSVAYWYQEPPVRPYFEIPPSDKRELGINLPKGSYDLPLPSNGEWWLCGPFGNSNNCAIETDLPVELEFDPETTYDGMHENGSPWLINSPGQYHRYSSEVSIPNFESNSNNDLSAARWIKRTANHGFIDFNHVFRPQVRLVAVTHEGVALARCILNSPKDMEANLRISWDDHLIIRINGDRRYDLGNHKSFLTKEVPISLRKGNNVIILKLSNTSNVGSPKSSAQESANHGGWAFAFQAIGNDGQVLIPELV